MQHTKVADGSADHCCFHGGGGCSYLPPLEQGWAQPSLEPWSLATNLDWLAAQVATARGAAGRPRRLTAAYFDGVELTTPVVTRIEPRVDFDWGWGSPSPSIAGDTFAARARPGRWSRPRRARTRSSRRPTTAHACGSMGACWSTTGPITGPVERSGTIELTAGRRYSIRLEYFERYWGATARLLWSAPAMPKEVVPPSALFPAP